MSIVSLKFTIECICGTTSRRRANQTAPTGGVQMHRWSPLGPPELDTLSENSHPGSLPCGLVGTDSRALPMYTSGDAQHASKLETPCVSPKCTPPHTQGGGCGHTPTPPRTRSPTSAILYIHADRHPPPDPCRPSDAKALRRCAEGCSRSIRVEIGRHLRPPTGAQVHPRQPWVLPG